MMIECRVCHAQYDCMKAGENCPECGALNKQFRSSPARAMMDLDEYSERYFGEHHQQCMKSRDPMDGVKPLRRVMPSLRLLALALAVATLARFMIEMAQRAG